MLFFLITWKQNCIKRGKNVPLCPEHLIQLNYFNQYFRNMLNCFTKNSHFHIYQQLNGSRSPSWITSLRINHPSPYQPVKVRSLDYTIVVVALWKVLCDQQLIHLVCQSLLASGIFHIFYLCFSYPHVLFLPLVFQTRVTDKRKSPYKLSKGKRNIVNESILFIQFKSSILCTIAHNCTVVFPFK